MQFFDQYDLKQIENLDLFAKQVVEGFIIGLHKSPFHGFSVEFAEHRLYNAGEPTKNIDWKVFARTDRLYSKKFEEETNLRCQIVIDTSSSMYFPDERKETKAVNKLRFSSLAAASLMNLLRKQRDAFGLSLFDEEVNIHTKNKSNTSHYLLLLSYLENLIANPVMNNKTFAINSLHQIADNIHKRSLVIIFSDLLDSNSNLEDLFSALLHLKHNKHEVILFHVADNKKEWELDYDNRPYLFIDMETGEKVKLQTNEVKTIYSQKMKAYKEEIKNKCMQYNIDYVDADIKKGFYPILNSYLVKRNRMMI
ncbi:MAG TPA: DUF58 domain-containing protein [Bacteroidetes bacterium]|nr:DUF58 domain-containing protein [Bacteroidota bacterium]